MMNNDKQLHILFEFGGQWEDAWENPILASFDLARLEKNAQDKREELARRKKLQDGYYEFHAAWVNANPAPLPPPQPELLPIPRWEGHAGQRQVITDEMREERRNLQAENARRVEVAEGPYLALNNARIARMQEALDEWEMQNGCIGISKKYIDIEGYRIAPVVFME